MKSLFTKVLVAGLAFGTGYVANAQDNIEEFQNQKMGKQYEVTGFELNQLGSKHTQQHGKLEVNEWYNYINALTENGEAYTYFTGNSIWPDSSAVQIFEDENGNKDSYHVGTHAVGQMLDPKSEHFALLPDNPPLSRHNAYTVDSIAFFYKYNNVNPGVVDTVLIEFYNNAANIPLRYSNSQTGQQWFTAAPRYNKATNSGFAPTSFIKVPISESTQDFYSNQISSFNGVMEVATNLPETEGGAYTSFTVSFIPGMAYNFGDTISNDSLVQGSTPMNSFMPLVIRQGTVSAPAFLEDTAYSHGLFIYSFTRYSTSTNPLYYYAGNLVTTPARQHLYSLFKLSSANVGVEELSLEGYGLGNAYPNPANSNDVVNIPFALGNSEDVSIELFDLVGKSISTVSGHFGAGDRVEAISTNNLKPGIYMYTITAGDYTATKKFTIK